MLKIGVVGAGHLGKIHINQIKEVNEFQLIGFFDSDLETSKKVSDELGVKAFDSYDELISAVDAVDIVTPTISHYEIAKLALQKTKHIFIEKPIAKTIDEAESILRLVNEAGVVAQVGHVERFNPAFLALSEFDIVPKFIEIHRLAQWNPRGIDVSVVHDLMIHDIDVALHLVKSEVRRINANGVAVISSNPDIANARIEFNNGCVVNLTASRISMKNMRKMRIFQPNAYVTVDFLEKSSQIFRISNEITPGSVMNFEVEGQTKSIVIDTPVIQPINSIRLELQSFANAILNKTEPIVTVEDALNALKIAQEITEKISVHA